MRRIPPPFPRNASHSSDSANSVICSVQKLNLRASYDVQNFEHRRCFQLLQNPAKIASFDEAKSLHGLCITMGSSVDANPIFIQNNIICKYAYFGEIAMARKLFDEMRIRNVVSYNTMIGCYSRSGSLTGGLNLFREMRNCGLKPSQFTFGSLLSCDGLDIFSGVQLQGLVEKSGLFFVDAVVGTALLTMYAKNGLLDEAVAVFDAMPLKNLVACNSVISVFGQMGFLQDCVFMLSHMMSSASVGVSEVTFINILSVIDEHGLELGDQIHGLVKKLGFDNVGSVINCLINMYGKASSSYLAEKMFEDAPEKDIVSWNTLIGAAACSDKPYKALQIFLKMQENGVPPTETTLANMLKSCSRMQTSVPGACIHAIIIKKRLESEVYPGSALVNFYAKFDQLEEARECFDAITHKSSASWNSLLAGYSNRDASLSLFLLREMLRSEIRLDEFSFPTAIKSSLDVTELRQVHSLAVKTGYEANAYVSSSLVVSYARNDMISDALSLVSCSRDVVLPAVSSNIIAWIYNRTGEFEKTQELYAEMENPDGISWNILIAACSRNGDYRETFELFDHMLRSQILPDNYTFVSLFSVCTRLCNLALGSSLHGFIHKTSADLLDTFVCNTMIDMYGKCGSLDSCRKMFSETREKNIISWTALISALGLHGCGNEALERFREIEEPDRVAFLAFLSACRHEGLVEEGMSVFNQMHREYGIEPDVDHYVVVVDLLARFGHVKEAEKLILGMPFAPNALIWRSFLQGCKKRTSHACL